MTDWADAATEKLIQDFSRPLGMGVVDRALIAAALRKAKQDGLTEAGVYSSHIADAIRHARLDALEQAALRIQPTGKRPCDCDVCDCGNRGDTEAVAAWDEATSNAGAIRALKGERS
jgi:hypothetical protein